MSRHTNYRGGGSISVRKDGRWQARLQVNGARKTLYATSEKEARKKLAELQRQAGGGTWSNPGTRTVDDLLSLWLEAAGPGLKVTTMAWYTAIAAKHIRPALGRLRINKLEAAHLQRLYAMLSGRTAQAVHRMLHRACKLAVMWRWMDANPTERVLPPTYRPARKDVWTLEELGRFLEGTAEHWLSPLWTIALVSGCRIGELLCLRWTDADLEAATIRIRGNLQRVKRQWVVSSPKTKAGDRAITLPPEGVTALRRQKIQQTEWRLKAGQHWQDSGLVFSGPFGGPLHRATVNHAMRRECQRLELRAFSPHGLRHLHASLLLEQGLAVPVVSARLGHSHPSITMAVYAHVVGSSDRQAAEAIGKALARAMI